MRKHECPFDLAFAFRDMMHTLHRQFCRVVFPPGRIDVFDQPAKGLEIYLSADLNNIIKNNKSYEDYYAIAEEND